MGILVNQNLRFDQKMEKAYTAWLDGDSRHLLRITLGFGAVAYLINHFGDYAITGADVNALLLIRVSVASILIGILGIMFLFRYISPAAIVISVAIIVSVINSIMAQFMPGVGPFWLATAQTLVALVLTMIVLRFRVLVVTAMILFIVPTAFTAIVARHSGLMIAEGVLLATAAGAMVFIGHFVEQNRRTIFKLSEDLHYSATHDTLTGAYNRRRVLDALEHEAKKFERFKRPVAVLCIDIDHFKRINDTYGHPAGDDVLQAMTQRVTKEIRGTDFFGRIGREEFLVVLPETNFVEAEDMAERLRQVVEELDVPWHDQSISCTISIGLAQMVRSDDVAALLTRADHALYWAKDNGRNRVETEKALVDTNRLQLNDLTSGASIGANGLVAVGSC